MAGKFELMNAKGTRDFLPAEAIDRQRIIDTLKSIFEKYGYSPLETPAIERKDVLSAKFAGGAEIMKEVFGVVDQGGRDLALRYDLTVPLSKVVGMNPTLPKPFKRYQIQPVWRDGPIKLGRYREFMQCDVDVVGTKSMLADAEILAIVSEAFKALGFEAVIKVNNRKLLDGLLDSVGIKENKMDAILSIDKLEKSGAEEVKKELKEKGFASKEIESLLKIFAVRGNNAEILEKAEKTVTSDEGKEGAKELGELLEYSALMGFEIRIDLSLARGLEYYTGPVFEVFLKDSKISSSVAGGGRYDRMIGMFMGGGEFPATGISFGVEPIFEAMNAGKDEKTESKAKTVTQVLVIPIQTLKEAIKVAGEFRAEGIKTEIDLSGRGISSNLNYANSLRIPYVVFVGKKELAEKKVKLRDMRSGKEKMLKAGEVKKEIGV